MTPQKLRNLFVDFFIQKGHRQIPSATLIPENDPTVLFTTAGMHPLVPYLLGQPHPLGKRLCSVQKCLRTDDIEEVGDTRHFTFFEMLGNWSLGDYFKKEAIEWSWEFLTSSKWLNLNPNKIYVSVFEGDKDAPKDNESIKIWQAIFEKFGIKAAIGNWQKPTFKDRILQERIFMYGKKQNWWGPAGQTGPCGPDTEIFYDTGLPHNKKFGKFCHPNCDCGRFFEIWNDVFMEYNKKIDGSFDPLKQKNVDTGLGLERMIALVEFIDKKIPYPDPYLTELFNSIIRIIELKTGKDYHDYPRQFRIILDHIRAAVFIIADGVEPSNKDRGYVLRRLIRRAIRYGALIGLNHFVEKLAVEFINNYNYTTGYKELAQNQQKILTVLSSEEKKFQRTLNDGLKIFKKELEALKMSVKGNSEVRDKFSGKVVFDLYQTYGFPPELVKEELKIVAPNLKINEQEFEKERQKHQQLSREGAKAKFSGGLQDHSLETTKLHTATHLLHAALRKVLGNHVQQVGSNITAERLRFDFTHQEKLSSGEIKRLECLINEQIKKNLPVKYEVLSLNQAKKQGALAFFGQKYPEKVKVYSIGAFSKEVCGGPHVDFTGTLGTFKIIKEEAVGAGKRRIYAICERKS